MAKLLGTDVQILMVRDDEVEATLTDLQNFNAELKVELLESTNLGETTTLYEEVFAGATFDFEMHVHTADYVALEKAVIERARRRNFGMVINVVAVFKFPNGDEVEWTFPDAKFGGFPMAIGGQKDYAKLKISGACSEPDQQT